MLVHDSKVKKTVRKHLAMPLHCRLSIQSSLHFPELIGTSSYLSGIVGRSAVGQQSITFRDSRVADSVVVSMRGHTRVTESLGIFQLFDVLGKL